MPDNKRPAIVSAKLLDIKPAPRRFLPVFILADISGSMAAEGKIVALNEAIRSMLHAFEANRESWIEIVVSVIAFGGNGARVHRSLEPSREVAWSDMKAGGTSQLAAGLDLVTDMIEPRDLIPPSSFRPVLILVSDGILTSTDLWERSLERLKTSRAGKADRMALAIGSDASEAMLKRFAGDSEKKVFRAEDAKAIANFFRYISIISRRRSQSLSPEAVPSPEDIFDLKTF